MPPRVEIRRSTSAPGRGARAGVEGVARWGGARGRGRAGRGRGRGRGAQGAGRGGAAVSAKPTVQRQEEPYEGEGEASEHHALPGYWLPVDPERQSRLYDSFLKKQPPRFKRDVTPEVDVEFLKDIVGICRPMGLEEELWVTFATSRFQEGPRD